MNLTAEEEIVDIGKGREENVVDDGDDNKVHESRTEEVIFPPPAPTFTGSLQGGEDDDVSSDESDSENDKEQGYTGPPLMVQDLIMEDSDEELEINPELARPTAQKPPPSLLDAMSNAVEETERAPAIGFDQAPTKTELPVQKVTTSSDDTFGITFKPSKTQQSSVVRSGPAFQDEKDFEAELNIDINSMAQRDDLDDEFGFDQEEEEEIVNVNIEEKRKELLEKEQQRQEEIIQALKAETAAEIEANEKLTERVKEELDLKTANSNALNEMHDMYKRGLGDQSVLLDEESPTVPVGSLNASMTIEEGDEEEEDRVEAEEEERKIQEEEKIQEQEKIWENVERTRKEQEEAVVESVGGKLVMDERNTTITYPLALAHFQQASYVHDHMDAIVPYDRISKGCLSCLNVTKLSFPTAIQERDLVFCIAKCEFQDENVVHERILQTIYRKFTGTTLNCPRIGPHWDVIGFQGTDPATDLRGVGMLGLLQMLNLLTQHEKFAHEFYRFSMQDQNSFPMMCVSINISLNCLIALRTGALYPECNKQLNIISALNKLHACICYKLIASYKTRSANGELFPIVMQSVLSSGKDNPIRLMGQVSPHLNRKTEETEADERQFSNVIDQDQV